MSQPFHIFLLYYLKLRNYFDIKYDLDFVRANGFTSICLPIELCVILSYSDAQHYGMIYCGTNATASKSAQQKMH
jgi:hypothetical protein